MEQNIEKNVAETETEATTTTTSTPETKIDFEAEYTRLMAENKKLKTASDKNASEAAEFKRKWKSSLDENQQAILAKEETDKAMREELEALRRESSLSKMEKSFLALGYSEKLASKAANAQLDGDTETLFSVQKEVMESMRKSVLAELTKSMPTPPIGNETIGITKDQFEKMSLAERSELYNKDKALYESLAK